MRIVTTGRETGSDPGENESNRTRSRRSFARPEPISTRVCTSIGLAARPTLGSPTTTAGKPFGRTWYPVNRCPYPNSKPRSVDSSSSSPRAHSTDTCYRSSDGRSLKRLNLINKYTRECLALQAGRGMAAEDIRATLADVAARRGSPPQRVRSDNGPEFAA